jgi:hypothetical protein
LNNVRTNHHAGAQELLESLLSAYKSENSEEAYGAIQTMIGKLGDPYTRMVPARCAACVYT